MALAVLHPQDCFPDKPSRQTLISKPPNMKFPSPNPKLRRNSRTNSNRKNNRHPSPKKNSAPAQPNPQPLNNKLVMGQVKILKRGEKLTEATPLQLTVTESTSKLPLARKADGLYAGYSLSVVSPPPSSVPLPAFVTKKIAALSDATAELRRVLQL